MLFGFLGLQKRFGVWDTYDVMNSEWMIPREILTEIYDKKKIVPPEKFTNYRDKIAQLFNSDIARICGHLYFLSNIDYIESEKKVWEREGKTRGEILHFRKIDDDQKGTKDISYKLSCPKLGFSYS